MIAEEVHRLAAELFSHLPADEIGDDEPLEFRVPAPGRFEVKTAGALYHMLDGAAVRWRWLEDEQAMECVAWQDRRFLGARAIEPQADIRSLLAPPELN